MPTHRARSIPAVQRLTGTIAACVAAAVLIGAPLSVRPAQAGDVPTFAVDASWPKPLPNNWILGQVAGIAVDEQGHIWIIQRPRTLTDDEKARSPRAAAHQMLRPGAAGAGVRSRRQPAALLGRPRRRLSVVRATSTASTSTRRQRLARRQPNDDDQILKFTPDGKFLLQIGKIAPARAATTPRGSAGPPMVTVDKDANEIYVADGYGNQRVIVFDATTGAFKRTGAPTASRRTTTSMPPYDPKRQLRSSSAIRCIASSSSMTGWSMSATAPTTASRCSRRTAPS